MDLLRALSVFWKTLTSERKYFDKQGECLWILAVTRSSLDVITSVAASVIVSLLLNSGDVEENPGPGHGGNKRFISWD